MNKTELTKRNIHGHLMEDYFGNVSVIFITGKYIEKINKLFPTIQIYNECFSQRGMGECYIKCVPSKDYKQIIAIGYVIYCYKYNYKAAIDGKDIFNEEELKLIEDEALKLLKEREIE